MHSLSNFGLKIIFMGFDYFWHQQHFKSLFKGTIGHLTSYCKWPIVYSKRVINNNKKVSICQIRLEIFCIKFNPPC